MGDVGLLGFSMDFRLRKIFQKSGGFQLKLAVSMARFWGSFLHPAVVIGVVCGFRETFGKIGETLATIFWGAPGGKVHAKTYQWNTIPRGRNLTALGFLKPISRQKMYLQLKDVARDIPPKPF